MGALEVLSILAIPLLLVIAIGYWFLRRAMVRSVFLLEEYALAIAWVFLAGGLVWLGVFLGGSSLLGFGAPWNWLAAAHFAFAGFGALSVSAMSCRVVSRSNALKVLRFILVLHPISYLITAAGIYGFRFCDEIGAGCYALLFLIQLGSVWLGNPDRIAKGPRSLLLVALSVPIFTMIPALAWACGVPILDLDGMVKYHGMVNAIGHVGLGFLACAWGRPLPHDHKVTEVAPNTPWRFSLFIF